MTDRHPWEYPDSRGNCHFDEAVRTNRIDVQIAHDCRTLQMVIDDLFEAWNCSPIGHSHVAASRSQIEFAFMCLAALRASINQASTSPQKLAG